MNKIKRLWKARKKELQTLVKRFNTALPGTVKILHTLPIKHGNPSSDPAVKTPGQP
jgi:hypothetical protein